MKYLSAILAFTFTWFLLSFIPTQSIKAQVTLDSSRVYYEGDSIYKLYGRATFVNAPQADEYSIGFIWGTSKDNLSFAPMGGYQWNNSLKQLTWNTEIVNLPQGKYFFAPQVLPKNVVSKFQTTNQVGWLNDIYQEPTIGSDLPQRINGIEGQTVTFTIYAEGENLNYEWYRRTMNPDTTWNDPIKINGQTEASYTTPALQLNWDGWKVFVKVYNNLGEIYSRQTLLRIF